MSHSEASLKALTVPKLKELLAAAGLSQAGKKDELIARLLEGGPAVDPAAAVEVTSNEAPDAPAPETTAPAPVAVQVESTSVSNDAVPVNPAVPEAGDKPAAPAAPEPSAEEKAAALKAEQDKRDARAARFGAAAPSNAVKGTDEEEAAKAKRAEKYGTGKKEAVPQGIEKSLAALDQPLGARALREPKQPKAATAPVAKEKAAPKAPEPPKEVDPAIAAKLAEEEEKKRKRAERFGAPPDAKKAKVDE